MDQKDQQGTQAIFNQYVQYPTAHMPTHQKMAPETAGPVNPQTATGTQPKLSNKNPVMHLHELRKGQCETRAILIEVMLHNVAVITDG